MTNFEDMDDIAREYIVLALALGQHGEGIVDAYYGPVELREVATADTRGPSDLAAGAARLREQVNVDEPDEQRRRWLDRQLLALETLARQMAGEDIPYVEEVQRCFDATPEPTSREVYGAVRSQLNDLLPDGPSLRERLDARDARLTIPTDRLSEILEWITAELRGTSAEYFPTPEGESIELSLVTGQPWSAYNWYDGNLRSRVEFNTDLPTRAHTLVSTMGHETFPGHHLEHAWKEQRLVREQGRYEATIQLINTPEAYISEGLAEVGPQLILTPESWQQLLVGVCDRAGIPMTTQDAGREWAINEAVRPLGGISGDAALMFHAEHRPLDEVRRFLVEDGLASADRAEKNIQFIGHPLWRTYVFCYEGGEQLLLRWVRAVTDEQGRRDRFFRLLTEQLTPSGIGAELAAT